MASSMKGLKSVGKMVGPIVVILGATATGKSKLAIEIATKFNGEIISADSMQIYKGLDIVTNKVTKEEQSMIRHHFIDCVSPLISTYAVTDFRDNALPLIDNLHRQNKLPIIVGGTNYYIESLLWKFTLDAEIVSKVRKLDHSGIESNSAETGKISALKGDSSGEDSDSNSGVSAAVLHQRLMILDPQIATRIHPNDRRKIVRALEIYEQTGQTKSEHLQEQQNCSDFNGYGGPLRFPDVCMLWVQCDQKVLDERINRRVEEMLAQGLLAELDDFHKQHNSRRISEAKIADYTHGIFQSIGFKEFHGYLLESEDERRSEKGQRLLQQGIDEMKTATRRYARRQIKWIVNRFIRRQSSTVPPIYAVDSTDVYQWEKAVAAPAAAIVSAFLKKEDSSIKPLPFEVNRNGPMFRRCSDCDVVLVSKANYEAHISGRRHKKRVESKRRLEKFRVNLERQQNEKLLALNPDSSSSSESLTFSEEFQNNSVTSPQNDSVAV